MTLTPLIRQLIASIMGVLILLVIILWMSGSFQEKIEPDKLPVRPEQGIAPYHIKLDEVPVFEHITGTATSKKTTDIAAQIQARIKAFHAHPGDTVKTGDLLITLDDSNLAAKRQQAKANTRSVKARLEAAKAHFLRIQKLYDQESATLSDLETAEADFLSTQALYTASLQQLAETQAIHDYSEIRASYSARVVDKFAETGNIAQPGMKLLSLYDASSLRIEAYVPESIAISLKIGDSLQAELVALNQSVNATIEEIVPSAHIGARSFLVKLRIEQRPELLPGMFIRLKIPLGTERAILIPPEYIHSVGQLNITWTQKNDQIFRRFIKVGQKTDDGRIKVISGLHVGDIIVKPILK